MYDTAPAAVQQRAAGDELLARHQHHEQGVVGDPEQNRQAAHQKRHDVHLSHRQQAQHRRNRDRGQQRGPAHVGCDHQPAPVAATVGPDTRVQREQQARHQVGGDQVAHLGRPRVQRQHRHQRQRQRRHLVAHQRDRLRHPEAAERGVFGQQLRDQAACGKLNAHPVRPWEAPS
jgi:hypothetical protein